MGRRRNTERARVHDVGRGRALPHFAALAPYNVILVALDEDPSIRLTGNLLLREGGAINEVEPSEIRIGAAVRVVFEPLNDAIHLPRWIAI